MAEPGDGTGVGNIEVKDAGFTGAGEMAALGATEVDAPAELVKASEFVRELADLAENSALKQNLAALERQFGQSPRLWHGEDEVDPRGSGERVSEASIRGELKRVVKRVNDYLANPGPGSSSTLMDLEQGDEFDATQRDVLFAAFGTSLYAGSEPVPDDRQPDRFTTTIYPTNVAAMELVAWEHHPTKPTLQNDGTNKVKYYLRPIGSQSHR